VGINETFFGWVVLALFLPTAAFAHAEIFFPKLLSLAELPTTGVVLLNADPIIATVSLYLLPSFLVTMLRTSLPDTHRIEGSVRISIAGRKRCLALYWRTIKYKVRTRYAQAFCEPRHYSNSEKRI